MCIRDSAFAVQQHRHKIAKGLANAHASFNRKMLIIYEGEMCIRDSAGTAIYDTIPKKPAARESIRDKLKSAQKAQPPHTPKPQKLKGKDMEL